jgi:predicted phage-related endonuclease
MKVIDCVQGTPEWHAARCGVPSASNFDKIVCMNGAPSKQKTKYLYQLAGESITGLAEVTYQNANMLRGVEMEDEARQLYQLITGKEALKTGFCLAEGYGCSPDAFVEADGLLELKCPLLATHVGYLIDNSLPSEYFQQVQGQLLVTGRKWVDFMSYYPGMKPFIIRVTPDAKFHVALAAELKIFVMELQDVINKIK